MKRGTELEVTIERFGDRGKSIARVDGMVVLVVGGVPGDRVRVRVFRKKRRFVEAQIVELIEAGAPRVTPRCTHFGVCGGCKWQHVDYAAQCEAKRSAVVDAFRQVEGVDESIVAATMPAAPVFGYRNKMEFSFSAARWLTKEEIDSAAALDRSFALGLHVPGNFEKVLDLSECHLVEGWVSRLVNDTRTLARSSGWSAWNVRTHSGYLRHLVVRISHSYPEAMVNLVVSARDAEAEAIVEEMLRRAFPEVTTFVVTLNTSLSQTSYGETTPVFGPGFIRDTLGGHTFRITPAAFFQTNTAQAERLYGEVVDLGNFRRQDLVFDLYCGAGTIGMFVSDQVRKVVGIEVIAEAVEAAQESARENGVNNVVFEQGDMLTHFGEDMVARHGHPDVVIVDPPRAGMHPKVVERLTALAPERIVYVSCNPRTMARDVEVLSQRYTVDALRPVDMFPHTHHTEVVGRLSLK